MKTVAVFFAGALFGIGLMVSGMSNPEKVLAFLTLNEHWDPALIVVMFSALITTGIGYLLISRRGSPFWASNFSWPENKSIDAPLVAGAALFGLGWGLSGYCPGPALVAGFQVDFRALAFLVTFLAGVGGYEVLQSYRASRQTSLTDG